MQISIRSLMLLCLYAAICVMTYVSANLWIGTAVVGATIILFSLTAVHAFNTQRVFPLVFSLCGSGWATLWLGFYAETDVAVQPWTIPRHISLLMRIQKEGPPVRGDLETYATMHSFHSSGRMGLRAGESLPIPSYFNSIRLFICLTGIGFGLVAASSVYFICRLFRPRIVA